MRCLTPGVLLVLVGGGLPADPVPLLAGALLVAALWLVRELVAYLLVAGFVGGFLYLVFTMTREPRDPDDDGAVL